MELVFKDISTFDAQNPIAGSLLKELDLGEKNIASNFIKKVPNTVDIEIQSRINSLNNPRIFNSNSNNNSSNNLLTTPPSQPPFQHPQRPTFRPPPTAPSNFQPAFRPSPSPPINFPPVLPPAQNNVIFNFPKTTATTLFGEFTAEKIFDDYKKQQML